jgi:hypothetical protein
MGYMIKGMTPIIETTNSILKATLKKESFEQFCGLLNFDLVSLNFDSDIFALSEVLMVLANLSSIRSLVSSDSS